MSDWGELANAASMREVWKGSLEVSPEPYVVLWWQAWQNIDGKGLDVLHVGVTSSWHGPGEDNLNQECWDLAKSTLGGLVNMAWKTVGERLNWEVHSLTYSRQRRISQYRGKIVVRAYSGRDFEPLMVAIQKTAEAVGAEET